jgi:hypothetical protein
MNRLAFLAALLAVCSGFSLASADDDAQKARAAEFERAKQRTAGQDYLLRYKFTAGETIRWNVVHLATVDTKIQGTTQVAKTRSESTKVWIVTSVDPEGRATFVHRVADINMWQKVTGRQEIRYDSTKDETPPAAYEQAASMVGIPLMTITIDPTGEVLERVDKKKQFGFGGGQITVTFPDKPLKIGENWTHDYDIPVRLEEGQMQRIKSRQVFRLEEVQDGVATIRLDTEVLTPLDNPKVKVQLVQRLSHGEVKFDIERGRVVQQQTDLDETVLAFNGADSAMSYLARFTEELLPDEPQTAAVPDDTQTE